MVRYRECQRNHAAHLGSRVVDGCGEFMPAGDEGTPESLRCAACDCHRNFHRQEPDNNTTLTTAITPNKIIQTPTTTQAGNCYISFNKHQPTNATITAATNNTVTHHTPIMMAFGGGGGTAAESSSEDLNGYRAVEMGGQLVMQHYGASKKRFRTKFTEEQKDKMAELADKIGWKMQKQNEDKVVDLCNEIGIKRQVFKVWMHNNKQALKKKQP